MRTLIFFIFSLFLGFYTQAQAANEELIFGPEWTFTNGPMLLVGNVGLSASIEAMDQLKKNLQMKCGADCRIESEQDSFKIIFKDQSTFQVTKDPGVLEVKASPRSVSQWKKDQPLAEKFIFEAMKEIGLAPHEREGAGHINVGLNYLMDRSPRLARNFVVDFYNHPGLGVVLNSLADNAIYAAYLDQMPNSEQIYNALVQSLARHENALKEIPLQYIFRMILSNKMIALRIHEDGFKPAQNRLEMRAVRPQQSMGDYIKLITLFEARIKYLETIPELIPLKKPQAIENGWLALGQFADYIEESGLNLKDFTSLMPKVWQNLDQRNFIRNSKAPKTTQKIRQCSGLF